MATKLPGVMPATNLTVTSTLKLNRYSVSFCVDGVEIGEYTGLYTFPIVYPEDPVKEGYIFKGWSPNLDTVPLGDVTIDAVFASKKLAAPTIYLDIVAEKLDTPSIYLEEEMAADEAGIWLYSRRQYNNNGVLAYTDYVPEAIHGCVPGQPFPDEPAYSLIGYTATEYRLADGSPPPAIMPEEDVKLYNTYNLNTYTATFMVDGEVYSEYSGLYTFPIKYPVDPIKDGYTFTGWSIIQATMPVDGITIEATFQVAKNKLSTPKIYLEVSEEADEDHYLINVKTLTDIADAIRSKLKTTDKIPVPQLAEMIESITGTGVTDVTYTETVNDSGGITVVIGFGYSESENAAGGITVRIDP